MTITQAIPFIILSNAVLFFLIGKYHERVAWNKLIKQGKIPAPANKCRC
jgi:hypothetical protein